jgi:hypothetical protein
MNMDHKVIKRAIPGGHPIETLGPLASFLIIF